MAATSDPPRVLCIGESMALLTPVSPTPLAAADLLRLGVAGAESTVALYLADLGINSAWASRLGSDPLGTRVIESIRSQGVDTSGVRIDGAAPTGVYFKDPEGDSTSVYYYRQNSAASHMDVSDLNDLPLRSVDLIHVSGITAALSASCLELVDNVLSQPRQPAPQVSFDVNFRPSLWSAVHAGPVLAELANRADLVFVGQDEAETLWGAQSPLEVRNVLSTPAHLVVKDGALGATDFADGRPTSEPAEDVDIVEVVGAGDAFAAGYIAGLLHGDGPTQRLAQGHRLAARTLTSMGDYVPGLRA